jgi:hypothetical protein
MSGAARTIDVAYVVEVVDDGLAVAAISDDLPGYYAFGGSIEECRNLVGEYLAAQNPTAQIGREVLLDADENPVSCVGGFWLDSERFDPGAAHPVAANDPRVLIER